MFTSMGTVGKIMTSMVAGTVAGVVARKWLRKSGKTQSAKSENSDAYTDRTYDRSERSKDAGLHYFVG